MAKEQDLLNPETRKEWIKKFLGDDNKARKAESLRRCEIYRSKLGEYLRKALKAEYAADTEEEMRKISSINPAKRIVNEMASIYKSPPARTFGDVNDSQKKLLEEIYQQGRFDVKFKKTNKYFKICDQVALQILPVDGVITAKLFSPHQYDVIPQDENPEKALAYVINTQDSPPETELPAAQKVGEGFKRDPLPRTTTTSSSDKELADMRFIWWTENYNFVTDGLGTYIPGEDDGPDSASAENPIGRLPFIDVAGEKDHEFYVDDGSSVIDFAVEFAVLLSDVATVNRNQGFSQAIFTGPDKPSSIEVGRQRVLFMKQDPDPNAKDPKFEFATPAPDLMASLEFLEAVVRYWLSSQGIDPKIVSGKGDAKSFSSGLERLLAMLDKFEASKDDIDIFKCVEYEAFELIVAWNNAYQGTEYLKEDLQGGALPEEASLDTQFKEPSMIQTQTEKEDSQIKLKKEGLQDDVGAVMALEEVDEDKAIELVVSRAVRQQQVKKMIDDELVKLGLAPVTPPPPAVGPDGQPIDPQADPNAPPPDQGGGQPPANNPNAPNNGTANQAPVPTKKKVGGKNA